jgi:hypothetical protein
MTKELKKVDLPQIDSMGIEKHVTRSPLEGLVDNPENLYTGPLGKKERSLIEEKPEHGGFMLIIHQIANYAELLGRASEEVGLVKDIRMVEPGYQQQQAQLGTNISNAQSQDTGKGHVIH